MRRPYYAAELAAVAVVAWPWLPWPATVALLALTGSWGAAVAIGAGLVWLNPAAALWVAAGALAVALLRWWSPVVAGQRLLEWTPRGDTLDTLRGRLTACRIALTRLTLRGHGPGSMRKALRRWRGRGVRWLPQGALLCEPIQIGYEYGVMGVVALVAVGVLVGVGLAYLGVSSVTAAGVSFGVFNLGHAPLRRLWAACRRVFPSPPMLGEVTVYVLHDGSFTYTDDLTADATAERVFAVASAMVRAGTYFAESRGVEIVFEGQAA